MHLENDAVVTDVERYELAFKRTSKILKLAMEHGWAKEDLETAVM